MHALQTDGSVLASLGELRVIEEQRVAEERAAITRAAEARVREREAAEAAVRDAEAARAAAAHAAEVAREEARARAEREARLHVETAEAAERARHDAVLAARRLDEEIALRREEVRRKRPRWMIAATITAGLAAAALAWFAVQSQREASDSDEKQRAALVAANDAKARAARADEELAVLQGRVSELNAQVAAAIDRVAKAQTKAEAAAAAATLQDARRRQAEIDEAIRQAKQRAFDKERHDGVQLTEYCKQNSLAKECLKKP